MSETAPAAADPIVDVTTVSDTAATIHATGADGTVTVHHLDGLAPDRPVTHRVVVDGDTVTVELRTLPRPPGPLLCRFATVNDVHFGEVVAGQIDDLPDGPIRRSAPGEDPYPEVMNRAAVAEIDTIDPEAVIVKGDLSLDGAEEEWDAFEACYRAPFGDRLFVVRGNHDAYRGQERYSGDQRIDLPGLTVALLDTAIPRATTGDITAEQAEWLDEVVVAADGPVFAMGHHQQWMVDPERPERRSDDHFGLHPDGSDRLDEVCLRRPSIVAYAAGHTHRHRRREMTASGIPSIEVGCTKDFPGTWAEYRVHEGGIMQIVHRISSPDALRWSEPCRGLYRDFGIDYGRYALGSIDDRCFVIPRRDDGVRRAG